jgi:hypothetical protein
MCSSNNFTPNFVCPPPINLPSPYNLFRGPQGKSGTNGILAYGNLVGNGIIDSNTSIPLFTNLINNNNISHSTNSPDIYLSTGNYLLQFSATCQSSVNGIISLILSLNGSNISISNVSTTSTTGNNYSLTNNLIINVANDNSILNIINNSTIQITILNISLSLIKLA